MTYETVIETADALRPNCVPKNIKYMWIHETDSKIAEILKASVPGNPYPDDSTLLLSGPYESIYYLYLIAMIDLYNQDITYYQADYVLYNNALEDAKDYVRRSNNPDRKSLWGVMHAW